MGRIRADERLVGIERVDRSRSALVDTHSLTTLASDFEDPGLALALMPRDLVAQPGGAWLAHIIQTFVLHDTVLVDSVLFDNEPAVSRAYSLFPDAIRGVFIRDSARDRVEQRVNAAVPRALDRPTDIPVGIWNRWMQLDSSEKPLLDRLKENPPRLVPPEYLADKEVVRKLDRDRPMWAGFPAVCLNSMMTISRAHFYLELARELAVPLNIDPVRATYLSSVVAVHEAALARGVPEKVIDRFANRAPTAEEPDIISFELNIPPVPEFVLHFAKARRVSLHQATLEVRNSKHAAEFRKWCAELFQLGEEGGLKARTEYRKMMKEFTSACDKWCIDACEGVKYETRTLKLGDIPYVGKVLKAVGLDDISIKDPVLIPSKRYRYFLFLNDLLRAPNVRHL
jgi:hypothetical protein